MATYNPLQSVTLSADTATIVFSGIDQNYTDLRLVISGTITSNNQTYRLQFNGDSSSGLYSFTTMGATSGGQVSYRYSSYNYLNTFIMNGTLTTSISNITLDIQSYKDTNTFKSCLIRSNDANSEVQLIGGLWRSTAAINSITVLTSAGSLAAGTTISLYGVKAGSPKAIGGDIVTTDGTYWYHAFKNSGTFTVQQGSSLSVDYLVVAGGGSGGYRIGGGGGAGGFRASASNSLNAGANYPVIVGAGGASTGLNSSNGSDSSINSFVSTGGGRGATGDTGNSAGAGGSGGGGSHAVDGQTGGSGNTPSTSPSQGNNGGTGNYAGGPYAYPGGGGGAGAAGGNGGASQSGAGGIGANSYNSISISSWLSATGTGSGGYLAAGGGGGNNQSNGSPANGGAGGGGNGVGTGAGGAATVNTGSGGGGGGNTSTYAGGNGGSGIVIVRYAV